MVHNELVARLKEIRRERKARLATIKTVRAAIQYQEKVLETIAATFSPVPPKTPLNARTTGILERKGYRIEKIIFESRPQCMVTANLYLPEKIKGQIPGVIGSCGHSGNGKAEARYQEFCQRLVHNGFAVLIYDPFSQGERDQYALFPPNTDVRLNCCRAHNMAGKQMALNGEYFGMWRAWDGIRSLDYLLERPEIDPSRVGITGNSGGGTMTSWLWGCEPRFSFAGPSCFLSTFLANFENEIPADMEQYPPEVIGKGLEMADFMICRAPKPLIMLGQWYDAFDRRGFLEAASEVQNIYRIFNAEEKYRYFLGENPHGYFPDAQIAMVSFFCKTAKVKKGPAPTIVQEEDKMLFATPKGDVVREGSKPIYLFTREQAESLAKKRKPLSGTSLAKSLSKVLTIPPVSLPHYRVLRPDTTKDKFYLRFAVETENNIRAIVRKTTSTSNPELLHTFDPEKKAILHVPHISSELELSSDSFTKKISQSPNAWIVDVRGIGESRPDEEHSFFHPYGMDYMLHGYSFMLGESYLGRRVYDLLTVIKLLEAHGTQEISLSGRGQGTLVALFAAILHGNIRCIGLKNAPISCEQWTSDPTPEWPATVFVRNLLRFFDLPDCYKELGSRLTLIEPWGPDMKPMRKESLTREMHNAKLPSRIIGTESSFFNKPTIKSLYKKK